MGLALSVALVPVGLGIAAADIARFILLPALRVATMPIFFLRSGDYRYGALAALVLIIISFSFFLGSRGLGVKVVQGQSEAQTRLHGRASGQNNPVRAGAGPFYDSALVHTQAVIFGQA